MYIAIKRYEKGEVMKVIEWDNFGSFYRNCRGLARAYTTCAYDFDGGLLDMSYNGEDDERVLENRKALADHAGTDLDHMVATWQQHTVNFLKVDMSDGGKGMYTREDAWKGYDAMYTRERGLWLYTFHADCCPVLLYGKDRNGGEIVSAIHSGWRGTVGEITGKVTAHLIAEEKVVPESIQAFIGPSLEQRNFQAGEDIIELVRKMSFDTESFYIPDGTGRWLLDSKGLIRQQLLNQGVPEDNIEVSPYCTLEEKELFFSYRRDRDVHRNITMIALEEQSYER